MNTEAPVAPSVETYTAYSLKRIGSNYILVEVTIEGDRVVSRRENVEDLKAIQISKIEMALWEMAR